MKIDAVTNTYKDNNEDSYGMTKNSFWVIDGASSLSKQNYTDASNDVVWIVNWWTNYLTNNLEQLNKSIQVILQEGIELLNNEFEKFTDIRDLSKLDRVSSAIAITRINGDVLECYVLGDVEILIKKNTNEVNVLTDESINVLDNQVMEIMARNKNRKNEIRFKGFTEEELRLLRKNRNTMNTENGYAILEHDKNAIDKGIYNELPIKIVSDILMVSDGFSTIYNRYHKCCQEEAVDYCKNKGLKNVLNEIRDIENRDSQMIKYKRLKCHDDATSILVEM